MRRLWRADFKTAALKAATSDAVDPEGLSVPGGTSVGLLVVTCSALGSALIFDQPDPIYGEEDRSTVKG